MKVLFPKKGKSRRKSEDWIPENLTHKRKSKIQVKDIIYLLFPPKNDKSFLYISEDEGNWRKKVEVEVEVHKSNFQNQFRLNLLLPI